MILYLMYPTLASLCFSLFSCTQLNSEGHTFLQSNLDIQCWTSKQHQVLIITVGIPLLVIYVIGFPTVIYCKMRKQVKERHTNKEFNKVFGLFFVGLKEDQYFWEIAVNSIRKLLIVASCTFLAHTSHENKVVLGLLILFMQTKIVRRCQPYLDPRFNSLELHGIYSAVRLLYFIFYIVVHTFRYPSLIARGSPREPSSSGTPFRCPCILRSLFHLSVALPLHYGLFTPAHPATASVQNMHLPQIHKYCEL